MKIANLSLRALHARSLKRSMRAWSVALATLALSSGVSAPARAFGGLWSAPAGAVKQSAQRILFVDHPDATLTAIIELKYSGPSDKLAWLIPVPGKPTVGVSSNMVIERLDAATTPQYWVEVATTGMCIADDAGADYGPGYTQGGGPALPDAGVAPGVIAEQDSVGPYDYATLMVDAGASDPSKLAKDWLTQNGYDLTGIESKVLEPYLKQGLNLLAFKLQKAAAPSALRPVVLTYQSDRPTIPIRPSAAAAQDDMGLLVWVVGPSQAVPENYKSLVLNDALIDWLSGARFLSGTPPSGGSGPFGEYVSKPSNYDAVVTKAADEAGGHGFVTEMAQPASQFRNLIWSLVDDESFKTLSGESYTDGVDAVVAARGLYTGWDGWFEALRGASTLPSDVTLAAFADDPDAFRGKVQVDASKFIALLEMHVVKPVMEAAALLHQAPYLTRLHTTLSPGEMTLDPSFTYNFDLAQLNNVHIAKQSIQCSPELSRTSAPWRMDLPQGGVVLGAGRERWPLALDALPANLKVVMLSTEGAGSVLDDHSEQIGKALFDAAGGRPPERLMPEPARTGTTIGGRQSVRGYDAARDAPNNPKATGSDRCSLSLAGVATGAGADTTGAQLPSLLLVAAWMFGRRAGRRQRAASADVARGARE